MGMRRLDISLFIADADGFNRHYAGELHQPAKPLCLAKQARSHSRIGSASGTYNEGG
jgi:hypothetical protein